MSTTLLLFDIDGTLLLSGGAGARALDRAFASIHGIAGAMRGVDYAGRTDPAILRDIFEQKLGRSPSPEEMEAVFEAYVPFLEEEIAVSPRFTVMPGVAPLLETLSSRPDLLIGLVTGNVERAARIKTARAGLERHFRYGGYGSDSADRVELTRLAVARGRRLAASLAGGGGSDGVPRAFVVGDTLADIRAARAAGAVSIAVATGGVAYEVLAGERPDLLLRDLSDPREFLDAVADFRTRGPHDAPL